MSEVCRSSPPQQNRKLCALLVSFHRGGCLKTVSTQPKSFLVFFHSLSKQLNNSHFNHESISSAVLFRLMDQGLLDILLGTELIKTHTKPIKSAVWLIDAQQGVNNHIFSLAVYFAKVVSYLWISSATFKCQQVPCLCDSCCIEGVKCIDRLLPIIPVCLFLTGDEQSFFPPWRHRHWRCPQSGWRLGSIDQWGESLTAYQAFGRTLASLRAGELRQWCFIDTLRWDGLTPETEAPKHCYLTSGLVSKWFN